MDSVYPETKSVLGALNNKLREVADTVVFTSQGIGNALSGLQSMAVDGQEVKDALEMFAKQLERCSDVMTPQDLSNALFGE
jgi:hypothetical protein